MLKQFLEEEVEDRIVHLRFVFDWPHISHANDEQLSKLVASAREWIDCKKKPKEEKQHIHNAIPAKRSRCSAIMRVGVRFRCPIRTTTSSCD
jgi:hypothetical protein